MPDKMITFANETDLNSFKFVLEAAENNGRTIFAPSERARLKLYPGGRNPKLTVTCGQAKVSIKSIKQQVTEFLAFRDSNSASCTYHIDSLVSAVWEGAGNGIPKINGAKLTLDKKVTGVLKVSYETSYDLVDAICSKPTYIILTAKTSALAGDTLVDFTDGYLTDIYDKDVVMTVRDACTRETLPDAHIYINDNYTGKTDSEGLIRLGSMKSGVYNLRITKDGYQPTDTDNINNDSFTVE